MENLGAIIGWKIRGAVPLMLYLKIGAVKGQVGSGTGRGHRVTGASRLQTK